MSLRYKYSIDDSALVFLASCSSRHRQELIHIFAAVAADPYMVGEAVRLDQSGRVCQIKIFNNWAVTFWCDHFESHVHILEVKRSNR